MASALKNEVNGHDSIERVGTIQSVNMTMEMFEKLYLSPKNRVHGNLRRTFGNPTPLPLLGFLISVSSLGCTFLGWQGAGGGGAATVGVCYFFGGLLQIIGSILEWIIGNTFPFIVFGSFGAFWLAFAATLTPSFNAEGAFTSGATTAAEKAEGMATFQASLGLFLVFMGVLIFMYTICALRTNIVFFVIFLLLDIAVFLLTGAYWKAAHGDMAAYDRLMTATGSFIFALSVLGWYLLLAQLLESVDFPLTLPVGDLSEKITKGSKKESDLERGETS